MKVNHQVVRVEKLKQKLKQERLKIAFKTNVPVCVGR